MKRFWYPSLCVNFSCSISDYCFKFDKVYYGFDLGTKKLPNVKECQNWCQEIEKCQMFVYAANISMCHLKYKLDYKLTPKKGLITGYKYCPIPSGMYILAFLFTWFNGDTKEKL